MNFIKIFLSTVGKLITKKKKTTKSVKVLSLFDGIGCGMLALQRAGIPVESYDAWEIDGGAIDIAKHNFPEIVEHGNVLTEDFTKYRGYDLLIGGSPCLAGDTLVLTNKGYKQISNVKVGEEVLSHDGKYHTVTNWFDQGVKTTYAINGMAFDEIRATGNHRFLVRIKDKQGFGEPEWKTVGELMELSDDNKPLYKKCRFGTAYNTDNQIPVLDGIDVGLNQHAQKQLNNLDLASETFWFFCGRWVGDSWFKNRKGKYSHSFVEDGILWYPIKSITEYGKENVYDIEVADTHSFIANNAITHNCQGFSYSGKMLNFNDSRSRLFFEFVRAIKEAKPKYFLLENVKMKQEWQDIISKELGVKPIEINSKLVSAQNRVRLYWTNIPNVTVPDDKGICLKDILEDVEFPNPAAIRGRNIDLSEECLKSATIVGRRLDSSGHRKDENLDIPITQCLEVRDKNTDKSNCLTTVDKDNVLTLLPYGRYADCFGKITGEKLPFRYYTNTEYERLQTLPDGYTSCAKPTVARRAIGNGWTVDVIAHIFSALKNS